MNCQDDSVTLDYMLFLITLISSALYIPAAHFAGGGYSESLTSELSSKVPSPVWPSISPSSRSQGP